MKTRMLSFLLIFILSLGNAFAHGLAKNWLDAESVLYVSVQSHRFKWDLQHFKLHGYDIPGVDIETQTIDLILTESQYQTFLAEGYQESILIPSSLKKAPDAEYKNHQEITEFLQRVHADYPEITKLESLGKSFEGRDIWALLITDNPDGEGDSEPAVVFNSMHHAREVMTPEVAIDIIEQLTQGYDTNDQMRKYVDNTRIYIVPMVNPDGNNKVWTTNNMWRKNARPPYGVDINRNYPYKWGSCGGSSGSQWSQTYRGASAGSEPETQALMGLIAKVRPVFDISYHSYSQLVLYPMGCRGQRAVANPDQVEGIGKKLGAMLNYKPGTPWEILYEVDGGDIDWMNAEYQVIPFVLELNSTRQGFQPKYSEWRDKTVEKNRVGWQYLLDRVQQSGVRGKVTNIEGPWTVAALQKGKVVAHFKGKGEQSFHLVLKPGSYSLEMDRGNGFRAVQSLNIEGDLVRKDF